MRPDNFTPLAHEVCNKKRCNINIIEGNSSRMNKSRPYVSPLARFIRKKSEASELGLIWSPQRDRCPKVRNVWWRTNGIDVPCIFNWTISHCNFRLKKELFIRFYIFFHIEQASFAIVYVVHLSHQLVVM